MSSMFAPAHFSCSHSTTFTLTSSSSISSSRTTSQVKLPINKHCATPPKEESGPMAKNTFFHRRRIGHGPHTSQLHTARADQRSAHFRWGSRQGSGCQNNAPPIPASVPVQGPFFGSTNYLSNSLSPSMPSERVSACAWRGRLQHLKVGLKTTFLPANLAPPLRPRGHWELHLRNTTWNDHVHGPRLGRCGRLRGRAAGRHPQQLRERHRRSRAEPVKCSARDVLRLRRRARFSPGGSILQRGDIVRNVHVCAWRAERTTRKPGRPRVRLKDV